MTFLELYARWGQQPMLSFLISSPSTNGLDDSGLCKELIGIAEIMNLKNWAFTTITNKQLQLTKVLKKRTFRCVCPGWTLNWTWVLIKKKEKRNTNKKCQAIIFIKYHKIPYQIYHKNPCFPFVQVKTGHFNRLRHLFRLGTWLSFWHLNGHLQYPEWYQINYFPFLLSTYSYH